MLQSDVYTYMTYNNTTMKDHTIEQNTSKKTHEKRTGKRGQQQQKLNF